MHTGHELDLALLPSLAALLEEESVSRAARRAGIGQPAMSRILGRLRHALGDPLLVRSGMRMVRTPRGTLVLERAKVALEAARRVVEDDAFDPATSNRAFAVGTTDYGAQLLGPGLVPRIRQTAPRVGVQIVPLPSDTGEALDSMALDLVIDVEAALPNRLRRMPITSDRLVCLLRKDHPVLREPLDIERFAALSHGLVRIRAKTTSRGAIDEALERVGRSRRIVLETWFFSSVPELVASSDVVFSFSHRLSERAQANFPVTWLELPIEVAPFTVAAAWSERHHRDPGHKWLRSQLAACVDPSTGSELKV